MQYSNERRFNNAECENKPFYRHVKVLVLRSLIKYNCLCKIRPKNWIWLNRKKLTHFPKTNKTLKMYKKQNILLPEKLMSKIKSHILIIEKWNGAHKHFQSNLGIFLIYFFIQFISNSLRGREREKMKYLLR